jgi:predicted DNA-binding transcriptional regulator AlpA
MTKPDPVGMTEIAQRLGVKRDTVQHWSVRKVLPPAEWTVGGRPAWSWSTIETWARETGRLREERTR